MSGPPDAHPPDRPRSSPLRWLLRLGGAALVAFFLYQVVLGLVVRSFEAPLVPGAGAVLATLAALALWYLTLELASEWVLRAICAPGRDVPWVHTAAAYFRHLLARYVPGKVWMIPARTESLVGHGIARHESARSVVYEQLHFMAASVVLALVVLAVYPGAALGEVDVAWLRAGLAVATVAVVVSVVRPGPLFRLVRSAAGAVLGDERLEALELEVDPWRWRVAFLLFLGVVVLQGAAVYPLVRGLLPAGVVLSAGGWLAVLGAYPVARLLGQLSLVAPGGVGVREGAYVLLVLPVLDAPVAAVVAVWARLLSVAVELAWSGALTLLTIRRGRSGGEGVLAAGGREREPSP